MNKKAIEKLSIIVPVYNESRTIRRILSSITEVELTDGIKKEIIVVNDGSSDDTEELVLKFIEDNPDIQIHYCKHTVNRGKGAALHTGIEKVTGDFLVIQDADLEYDPEEFNDLLKPVIKDYADVVYGSRFLGGNPHRILFFWHSQGNRLLTFLSNLLTNLNLTDMETCYKLFRTEIIRQLTLKEERFGFEPEVTVKISRIPSIKIYEVGISYYGRTYEEGKKIGWRDGIRALCVLVKYGLLKRN